MAKGQKLVTGIEELREVAGGLTAKEAESLQALAPQEGFFSILDELITNAPIDEVSGDQWRNYLKPGRALDREGVQFPLQKRELEETGLTRLLEGSPELDYNKGILRDYINQSRPSYNTKIKNQYRDDHTLSHSLLRGVSGDEFGQKPYSESLTSLEDLDWKGGHYEPDTLQWSRVSGLDDGNEMTRLVEEIQNDTAREPHKSPSRWQVHGLISPEESAAIHSIDTKIEELAAQRRQEPLYPHEDRQLENLRDAKEKLTTQYLERHGRKMGTRSPEGQAEMDRLRKIRDEDGEDLSAIEKVRLRQLETQVPSGLPMSDLSDYSMFELKKQLLNAVEDGDDYLAIVRGIDQAERSSFAPDSKQAAGASQTYDKIHAGNLRKLAGQYGAEFEEARQIGGIQGRGGSGLFSLVGELGHNDLADVEMDLIDMANDGLYTGREDDVRDMAASIYIHDMEREAATHFMGNTPPDVENALQTMREMSTYLRQLEDKVVANYKRLTVEGFKGKTKRLRAQDFAKKVEEPYHDAVVRAMRAASKLDEYAGESGYGDGTGNLGKTKDFPSLRITPEVADRVKKAGVGMAKGGKVKDAVRNLGDSLRSIAEQLRFESDILRRDPEPDIEFIEMYDKDALDYEELSRLADEGDIQGLAKRYDYLDTASRDYIDDLLGEEEARMFYEDIGPFSGWEIERAEYLLEDMPQKRTLHAKGGKVKDATESLGGLLGTLRKSMEETETPNLPATVEPQASGLPTIEQMTEGFDRSLEETRGNPLEDIKVTRRDLLKQAAGTLMPIPNLGPLIESPASKRMAKAAGGIKPLTMRILSEMPGLQGMWGRFDNFYEIRGGYDIPDGMTIREFLERNPHYEPPPYGSLEELDYMSLLEDLEDIDLDTPLNDAQLQAIHDEVVSSWESGLDESEPALEILQKGEVLPDYERSIVDQANEYEDVIDFISDYRREIKGKDQLNMPLKKAKGGKVKDATEQIGGLLGQLRRSMSETETPNLPAVVEDTTSLPAIPDQELTQIPTDRLGELLESQKMTRRDVLKTAAGTLLPTPGLDDIKSLVRAPIRGADVPPVRTPITQAQLDDLMPLSGGNNWNMIEGRYEVAMDELYEQLGEGEATRYRHAYEIPEDLEELTGYGHETRDFARTHESIFEAAESGRALDWEEIAIWRDTIDQNIEYFDEFDEGEPGELQEMRDVSKKLTEWLQSAPLSEVFPVKKAEGGRAERGSNEEEVPSLLKLLKRSATSMGNQIPFSDDESREYWGNTLAQIPKGFATQWLTTDPETGEAVNPFNFAAQGQMARGDLEGLKETQEYYDTLPPPGIVDDTLSLPAVGEEFIDYEAPQWSRDALDTSIKTQEGIEEIMDLPPPEGFPQHLAESLGIMAGQVPVPDTLFRRVATGLKELPGALGKAARWGTAIPRAGIEYLSPIVNPSAGAYTAGSLFGGVLGTLGDSGSDEEESPPGDLDIEAVIEAAKAGDPVAQEFLQVLLEEMEARQAEEAPERGTPFDQSLLKSVLLGPSGGGWAKGGKVKKALSTFDWVLEETKSYLGKEINREQLEIFSDPYQDGVYGVKVKGFYGDGDLDLVVRPKDLDDPFGGENIEEVEFSEWPPTSGGTPVEDGMRVEEGDYDPLIETDRTKHAKGGKIIDASKRFRKKGNRENPVEGIDEEGEYESFGPVQETEYLPPDDSKRFTRSKKDRDLQELAKMSEMDLREDLERPMSEILDEMTIEELRDWGRSMGPDADLFMPEGSTFDSWLKRRELSLNDFDDPAARKERSVAEQILGATPDNVLDFNQRQIADPVIKAYGDIKAEDSEHLPPDADYLDWLTEKANSLGPRSVPDEGTGLREFRNKMMKDVGDQVKSKQELINQLEFKHEVGDRVLSNTGRHYDIKYKTIDKLGDPAYHVYNPETGEEFIMSESGLTGLGGPRGEYAKGGKVKNALKAPRSFWDEMRALEIDTIEPEHSDPDRIAFARELDSAIGGRGKKITARGMSMETLRYLRDQSLPNAQDIWDQNTGFGYPAEDAKYHGWMKIGKRLTELINKLDTPDHWELKQDSPGNYSTKIGDDNIDIWRNGKGKNRHWSLIINGQSTDAGSTLTDARAILEAEIAAGRIGKLKE